MVSLGPAHERRASGISREPAPAIVFRRGGLDEVLIHDGCLLLEAGGEGRWEPASAGFLKGS
jgi:hypothetical protein